MLENCPAIVNIPEEDKNLSSSEKKKKKRKDNGRDASNGFAFF